MNEATWLYARLEFDRCKGGETKLVVYHRKSDADHEQPVPLKTVPLTNAELTEFLVDLKIMPKDLQEG